MADLKVGDRIDFVDMKHVLINGVEHKIVIKKRPLLTKTGITLIAYCEFVKDR